MAKQFGPELPPEMDLRRCLAELSTLHAAYSSEQGDKSEAMEAIVRLQVRIIELGAKAEPKFMQAQKNHQPGNNIPTSKLRKKQILTDRVNAVFDAAYGRYIDNGELHKLDDVAKYHKFMIARINAAFRKYEQGQTVDDCTDEEDWTFKIV